MGCQASGMVHFETVESRAQTELERRVRVSRDRERAALNA